MRRPLGWYAGAALAVLMLGAALQAGPLPAWTLETSTSFDRLPLQAGFISNLNPAGPEFRDRGGSLQGQGGTFHGDGSTTLLAFAVQASLDGGPLGDFFTPYSDYQLKFRLTDDASGESALRAAGGSLTGDIGGFWFPELTLENHYTSPTTFGAVLGGH